MRKFTMLLLLATSAIPAMAAAQDEGGRHGRQDQSGQSDDNKQRPAREERAERPERAQQNEQRQQAQAERQVQRQEQQSERQVQIQQMQAARQTQVQQIQQQQAQRQLDRRQVQVESNDGDNRRVFGGRNHGGQDGQASRDERMQQYREQMEQRRAQAGGQQLPTPRGVFDRNGRDRPVINPNVVGQPAPENRDARFAHRDRRDGYQWSSNNWRSDNRYDWRRYRDHHHSIFRIGFYFDPFGYSYNRFGIGSYMYPSYYQSNYWISDPWQYRLPQAYGPYRWVRYHNDALMIDTWSGEVVDVIYGFFW